MNKLCILSIALAIGLSTAAASGRGMGMSHMGTSHMSLSHMPVTGGAFGTSAATPGTNSLGTALPSSGTEKPMKGPLLGTSPSIDREEARVEKMMNSICLGC